MRVRAPVRSDPPRPPSAGPAAPRETDHGSARGCGVRSRSRRAAMPLPSSQPPRCRTAVTISAADCAGCRVASRVRPPGWHAARAPDVRAHRRAGAERDHPFAAGAQFRHDGALHVPVVGLAVALDDLPDGEPAVFLDTAVHVDVAPPETPGQQPPDGSLARRPVPDQHHLPEPPSLLPVAFHRALPPTAAMILGSGYRRHRAGAGAGVAGRVICHPLANDSQSITRWARSPLTRSVLQT